MQLQRYKQFIIVQDFAIIINQQKIISLIVSYFEKILAQYSPDSCIDELKAVLLRSDKSCTTSSLRIPPGLDRSKGSRL